MWKAICGWDAARHEWVKSEEAGMYRCYIFFCYRIPISASNRMRTQLLKNWAALGRERRKKALFSLGLAWGLRVAFSFLFWITPWVLFFSLLRNVTGADSNVIGPLMSNFCTKKLHFYPCSREDPHCKRTRAGHWCSILGGRLQAQDISYWRVP